MVLMPVVLVVYVLALPDFPAIHVDRFETESECRKAAAELDKSTPVPLRLECEVDT